MRSSSITLCTVLATGLLVAACSDRSASTAPTKSASATASRSQLNAANFISLVVPGSNFTLPLDINEHGVIVGRYAAAGHTHGFLRDETGNYTTIDFPGSSFTVLGAISDSGAISGWYILPATPAIRHGFALKDGVFTTIDPPGSTFTNITGINERGDLSGRYCTLGVCPLGGGSFHGFLVRNGVLTTFDVPGANETSPFKLEPNGTLAGVFTDAGGPGRLFVLSNGQFTTYPPLNGKPITEDNGGVDPHGDIVGTYCDVSMPCLLASADSHGFLLSRGGDLTTIDIPGAVMTGATGINARGDVVGGYLQANSFPKGFLLLSHHGATQ
jgi:uncharacterized membrane protein